jgi:hypothetical protein
MTESAISVVPLSHLTKASRSAGRMPSGSVRRSCALMHHRLAAQAKRHTPPEHAQLVTAATAAVLRVREFLPAVPPTAVTAAGGPFTSMTWPDAEDPATSSDRTFSWLPDLFPRSAFH